MRELQQAMRTRMITTQVGNQGPEIDAEVPRSKLGRVWEGARAVALFMVMGTAQEDAGESAESANSEGRPDEEKNLGEEGPKDRKTSAAAAADRAEKRAKKKSELEKTVFKRTLRIVSVFLSTCTYHVLFYFCRPFSSVTFLSTGMCHTILFAYEMFSGKPSPFWLDVVGNGTIMLGGLFNPLILVSDNQHFRRAYIDHYPFVKYLRPQRRTKPEGKAHMGAEPGIKTFGSNGKRDMNNAKIVEGGSSGLVVEFPRVIQQSAEFLE